MSGEWVDPGAAGTARFEKKKPLMPVAREAAFRTLRTRPNRLFGSRSTGADGPSMLTTAGEDAERRRGHRVWLASNVGTSCGKGRNELSFFDFA
jgi:hypothetical protein